MLDTNDIVDEFESELPNKRPDFLTVLCILTWVGSAFILLLLITFYEVFRFFSSTGNNSPNWSAVNYIVWIGACFLTTIGALGVWNLKKWGLVLYLIGQITPMLVAVITFLSISGSIEAGVLNLLFFFAVPIGFVVMYLINWKYLE